MKVFRYLEKQELDNILSGNIEGIGSEYDNSRFKNVNTHKYKSGVKYLHFFRHKEDIDHIIKTEFLSAGEYYVCEFNIPIIYLISGLGRGYYASSGYDIPNHIATEFKMPAKLMKTEYLISYSIHPRSLEWKNFIENTANLKFTHPTDEDLMEQ